MTDHNLLIYRHLPGRIRLQITQLKNNPALARSLSRYAQKSTLIENANFNHRTGRALLVYNPYKSLEKEVLREISEILKGNSNFTENDQDSITNLSFDNIIEPEDQALSKQIVNVSLSSFILLVILLRKARGKSFPWTQSPLLFNIAAVTTIVAGYPFFKSGLASLVKGHKVSHDAIVGLTGMVLVLLRESVPGLTVIWLANIIALIESIVLKSTVKISRQIVRENISDGSEDSIINYNYPYADSRDLPDSCQKHGAAMEYAHRVSAMSFGVAGLSYLTSRSIDKGTAILLASSPGAAGQAQPSVMATATALASRYGILPTNPRVMAKIANIRTFVITRSTILAPDLTLGNVLPVSGISVSYCLAVASALGINSLYYAGLFQDSEKNTGSSGYSVSMETDSPEGVAGTIDGVEAFMGTEEFMLKNGIKNLLAEFKTRRLRHFYQAPLYVAYNGILMGVIGITRSVPQYNRELLNRIAALGVKTVLITVEKKEMAGPVKAQTGIEIISGVSPSEIPEIIDSLRGTDGVLAVLGVGREDERALQKADLPIVLSGINYNIFPHPDLYINSCELSKIYQIVYIGRIFREKIEQNLLLVKGMNLAGLTLAATGKLSASGATIFNNLTGIGVALNSLSLINKNILLRPHPRIKDI